VFYPRYPDAEGLRGTVDIGESRTQPPDGRVQHEAPVVVTAEYAVGVSSAPSGFGEGMSKAAYLMCAVSGVMLWTATAAAFSLEPDVGELIAPLMFVHLFLVPSWVYSEGGLTALRSPWSWVLIISWLGALAIALGLPL